MGADLPDEPDVPPDGHADRPDDDQAGSGHGSARSDNLGAEPRSREEYYADLYVAVSAQQSARASQITAEEQAASAEWDEKVEESRWMWTEYQRRFPQEDRPQPTRPDDTPGSWREGDKVLNPDDNRRVEAACDRIAELEREKITPAMHEVESQDPDRHLIGFDRRLKGYDRIKEKVYDKMEEFGFSSEEAVSEVSDTIRFTFEYRETRYTEGVWTDIERLKNQGFELHAVKNSWSDEQYKGINSQWIEPDTGQKFEVQFHTRISFEAKQLTHDAYERLRSVQQPDEFEKMVLKAFQRKVSAEIPIPPGAADIPDYRERGQSAR